MRYVRRADRLFLWIQIFCLLFVVLIPASTSLIAFYGDIQICDVVFEINILIIGLLYLASWLYISRNSHLSDEAPDPEAMNREKAKTLLIVIFSILALIVSFVSPGWSTALYFLLPVLIVLSTFRPRHKEAGQGENV